MTRPGPPPGGGAEPAAVPAGGDPPPDRWLQARTWLAASAGALVVLVLTGAVGFVRAWTTNRTRECAEAFTTYDPVSAGTSRLHFPFRSACNATVDLVPGWVNPVFALAAVVCVAAAVMAYLVWSRPGGVVARAVAPAASAVEGFVRAPSSRAAVAALAMMGLFGVVIGQFLLMLAWVLHVGGGGTVMGSREAGTSGGMSLPSTVLLVGALGAAVVAAFAIGRATYRSVVEQTRGRR